MAIINSQNKYIKIDTTLTFINSDGLHLVYLVYSSKNDRLLEKARKSRINNFYKNLKKYLYENPRAVYYGMTNEFLERQRMSNYQIQNIGTFEITPFTILEDAPYGFGSFSSRYNNPDEILSVINDKEMSFLMSEGFAKEWVTKPIKIEKVRIALSDNDGVAYPFNTTELYKKLKVSLGSTPYQYFYEENDDLVDDL